MFFSNFQIKHAEQQQKRSNSFWLTVTFLLFQSALVFTRKLYVRCAYLGLKHSKRTRRYVLRIRRRLPILREVPSRLGPDFNAITLQDDLESLRHSSSRDLAALATQLAKSEEERRHLSDLVVILRQRVSNETSDDEHVAKERKLLEQRLEEAHLHLADIKTSWSDKIASLETQVCIESLGRVRGVPKSWLSSNTTNGGHPGQVLQLNSITCWYEICLFALEQPQNIFVSIFWFGCSLFCLNSLSPLTVSNCDDVPAT